MDSCDQAIQPVYDDLVAEPVYLFGLKEEGKVRDAAYRYGVARANLFVGPALSYMTYPQHLSLTCTIVYCYISF